jgi:hypothetical protein
MKKDIEDIANFVPRHILKKIYHEHIASPVHKTGWHGDFDTNKGRYNSCYWCTRYLIDLDTLQVAGILIDDVSTFTSFNGYRHGTDAVDSLLCPCADFYFCGIDCLQNFLNEAKKCNVHVYKIACNKVKADV